MKILHTVESYDPSIGGMQEVVKRLSELHVRSGHDVTVATRYEISRPSKLINGVKIEDFNITGNAVNGYQGPDVERYRKFLVESDFDVMVNFAAQQWASDLVYDLLPKIKAKKVFVPTGFSGLFEPRYQEFFETLHLHMRKYDAHIFLSDQYRDILYARGHRLKNLYLIPNGASHEEFTKPVEVDIKKKLGIPENDFLILHVGSHTGVKGHHFAINMFRQAKISDATFVLVGNSFNDGGCYDDCVFRAKMANRWPALDTLGNWKSMLKSVIRETLRGTVFKTFGRNKKVILANLTRAETIAAYHAADVFLFPSQIECSPHRIFECMASRTPFLSSKVGNAAEIIKWTGAGEILPTINHGSTADAITHLSVPQIEKMYTNAEHRNQLARAGHEMWLKKFTWEKIADQYLELYTSLVKNEPPKVFNPELLDIF